MAVEYLDIMDCRGEKTGEVMDRDEAHAAGAWHGAFHCLIIGERKGAGVALFQKRSSTKRIAPGKYDVSAGGHYASGEDAGSAGPREIREELGLAASYAEFVPLGRRIFVYCFTPAVREQEFQDVFLLRRNVRPEELVMQREELDGVIELELEQGIALFSGKTRMLETTLFKSGGAREFVSVTAADFVPCLDNYYIKLLASARRMLRGEREALVI
jgi:isopentenyldiphosphate isomerase